ncbi:hypothetical protein [Nocardia sp. NPDC050406]|uniref:hypothetical protein n=1 Tax=Nocardia sp. NPDC050406 TaxID=3364318 RepID=UPI00379B4F42
MNQRYRPASSLFSHAATPEPNSAPTHGAIERPVFSSDSVAHPAPPDDTETDGPGN